MGNQRVRPCEELHMTKTEKEIKEVMRYLSQQDQLLVRHVIDTTKVAGWQEASGLLDREIKRAQYQQQKALLRLLRRLSIGGIDAQRR